MTVQPNSKDLEKLQNVLQKAFDGAALTTLVREQLNLNLEWVTPKGEKDLITATADLVAYFASLEGGLIELIDAAVRENPHNRGLANLAGQWGSINFEPVPLSNEHPQFEIRVGDIQNSTGLAIGPNAQSTVTINNFVSRSFPLDSNGKRRIRVFVASPGDVAEEREKLAKIIGKLNKGETAKQLNLSIELLRWETDAVPDLGRPQQVILDQLADEEWDIFVGILWLRFGSSPKANESGSSGRFSSGTEEEFHVARQMREKNQRSWPKIMFYHCGRPPKHMFEFDLEQFQKVSGFFSNFAVGGSHEGLVQRYISIDEFEDHVRGHFEKIIWEVHRQK